MRVLILLPLLLLAGCAGSQPAPLRHSYLVQAARGEPPAAPRHDVSLKIVPLKVAAPFQGKSFVYRLSELRYEADPYHEFFTAPGPMLAGPVGEWLAASGAFRSVLPAASTLDGAYTLEGIVTELYGDYRDSAAPQAVVAIQFRLFETDAPSRVAYGRTLQQAIPLSTRNPEALAEGFRTGLGRLLQELERDLRALELAPSPRERRGR